MFNDDDEQLEAKQDDQELLLRMDYLELRIVARVNELEGRVRKLEADIQTLSTSGVTDLRRINSLVKTFFGIGRDKPSIEIDDAKNTAKSFPIKEKWTQRATFYLCALVSIFHANEYGRSGGEELGYFVAIFIQVSALPILIAYLVAGRHGQQSRNDKWCFWGSLVTSIILLLKLAN